MSQIKTPKRSSKRHSLEMRGISRIDIPSSNTHGWEVRVTRRRVAHAKFFPDRRHGGKRKALEAAKQERDRIIAENPGYTRAETAKQLRSTNRTGMSGVVYRVLKVRRKDKISEYPAWVATGFPEPGVRKTRIFFIRKWGDKACKMAIEQRKEWERQMKAAST